MFDDVNEQQLNFLSPYIEEFMKIDNSTSQEEYSSSGFVEKIEKMHFEIIEKANENIESNKLKFGLKAAVGNPYGRTKLEKLPVPNLYSALIFSNLWTSKMIGVYQEKLIAELPEICKNNEGEIDRDLAFQKIYAAISMFANYYFSGRDGKKRLKEWGDYLKVPLGNEISVMATFYLFPIEFFNSLETIYEKLEAAAKS